MVKTFRNGISHSIIKNRSKILSVGAVIRKDTHALNVQNRELGHVKLSGASLTFNKQTPNHDAVEPDGSNTRVCRVLRNLKAFEFDGSVDKKSCILKIDSGSDVTILNTKFVEPRCHRIPPGEDVPIKFKTVV